MVGPSRCLVTSISWLYSYGSVNNIIPSLATSASQDDNKSTFPGWSSNKELVCERLRSCGNKRVEMTRPFSCFFPFLTEKKETTTVVSQSQAVAQFTGRPFNSIRNDSSGREG